MKQRRFVTALIFCALTACQCQCANTITLDGGTTGGGSGGSAAGTGGGAGAGGAGGGMAFDAGDGTMHNPTGPGSGGPGFVLDGGDNSQGNGVTLTPDGGFITLSSGSQEFFFMWIANNNQGWVSKYDTRNGREVARYYSTIPKDCANSAGPPCTNGNIQAALRYNQGNNPSRTAIDIFGDVWVANRAVGVQGSLTKIANDVSSCIDRDNDGKIKTSRDLNGDGVIDPALCINGECEMIVPMNPADPLDYDECVLFSTPVGAVGGDVAGRGVAISKGVEGTAGDVWFSQYREQRIYKMSTANGQIVPVNAAGDMFIQLNWGAYGLIVDSKQRLYAVRPGAGELAIVDTTNGSVITLSVAAPSNVPCGSYALGVDGKDRVWLAGWTTGTLACRYDHATGTWASFSFAGTQCTGGANQPFGRPRGIAVDDQGQVYMSSDTGAQLIRFDAETGAVIPFNGQACIDATDGNTGSSIGVGIDGDGQPWVNNFSGNVMRIDKVTGTVLRTPQQPGGLYTYSDFTGYQLRKFTAPRGTYRKDFEGCSDMTDWARVVWTADVPTGSSLQVFVKVGATRADLDNVATMRYGPFTTSPVDLKAAGVPKARFIRVEFVLLSMNGMASPVLKSFDVNWSCVIEPG